MFISRVNYLDSDITSVCFYTFYNWLEYALLIMKNYNAFFDTVTAFAQEIYHLFQRRGIL